MNRGAPATFLAIVATAAAVAIPSTAAATPPSGWNAPSSLPATTLPSQLLSASDPVGGALYFYLRDGVPTLSRVQSDGTLDSTTAVPSITGEATGGIPEQIAFRPDGSAIIAWKVQGSGHAYMAFRAESGAIGKPVLIDQDFRTLAVAGTNVMVLSADGSVVSQAPFTLSPTGALTSAGAPNVIYSGGADRVYATMDTSGVADVIIQGLPDSETTTQMIDVNRNAEGSWGTGSVLSDAANNVTDSSFAANPSGRAAVTWTETATDTTTNPNTAFAFVRTSMREPGDTFGWTGDVVNTNSTHGATATSLTAVGDDGTIAIAPSLITYSSASDFTVTNSVYITAPADNGLGTGVPVDIFEGPMTRFSTLAAGDGKAVAGYTVDGRSAGDSHYPSSYNVYRYPGVTIVNADGTTAPKGFGAVSGYYDPVTTEGCPPSECLGTTPPDASVLGTTIDSRGLVTAVGQVTPLADGDPVGFLSRYRYNLRPHLKLTSKALSATKKVAAVPLSCAKKDCTGKITMTAVVKHTHKHGKPTRKTVTIAKSAYLLEVGSTATVKVPFTKAGAKAIKAAPSHSLHSSLAITVTGAEKNLAKKVTVSK